MDTPLTRFPPIGIVSNASFVLPEVKVGRLISQHVSKPVGTVRLYMFKAQMQG